jgi:glutamate dehydrogenase
MVFSAEEWADAFASELSRVAPPDAYQEREKFLTSLPPGYRERTAVTDAARDWVQIWRLLPGRGSSEVVPPAAHTIGGAAGAAELSLAQQVGDLVLATCRPGAPGDFRLRRTGRQRVELSSLLPVLESFGLAVVEAVPWRFVLGEDGAYAFVDDIGLRVGTATIGQGQREAGFAKRLVKAIEAVLGHRAELSGLNRLVVGAALDWRQVNLLAAYRAYRHLAGGARAAERAEAIDEALTAFPAVGAAIVKLFQARLVAAEGTGEAERQLADALAGVPNLDHYEPLREVVSLVYATTRSSWALRRESIALKFASAEVPFLPVPKPLAEIFVWSPSFEGLHLRFGPVARGGIRWSDRRSDLRAEVLGLARAQVKKNSLIVPTGAKGGFVLRQETSQAQEGRQAYTAFIAALLDVTDNRAGGGVVHPGGVVCLDGEDPYLVVAPDKGTAAFSDLANELSTKSGFWLGDAFASGGSRGYDHKALGITARGAWIAVQRHFRALGMDAQHDELRVVGVGDMSGDVFGNAMLQSQAVRLIAAFDHRHIFVDPDPDPKASFEERARLSRLARSSWDDYDLTTAAPGAAVFSRQAKTVELSKEAAGALGVQPGTFSPPQLVKLVLQAPVDLLFFGGVGTFVRAKAESDVEVDDPTNDEVRVSAEQLRARVVVEGANLALTQPARVSYSRRGGRVNTDFVDNAGGVAMSDREVNLKILLQQAISAGRLSRAERAPLLLETRDAAAAAVLAQVDGGMVAIDRAAATSATDLPVYESLIDDLESSGALERTSEYLPGTEEMARRRQAGAGLTRPELAVITAYARSSLARSIDSSELVASAEVGRYASEYFPPAVLGRYSDLVPAHTLFGQLIASQLADEVIKQMGTVWAYELATELGSPLWEAGGAFFAAALVLRARDIAKEVDAAAASLPLDGELALRSVVASGLDRLARWYVRHRQPLAHLVLEDVAAYGELIDDAGPPPRRELAEMTGLGVPEDTAVRAVRLRTLASLGEVAETARTSGRPLEVSFDAWRRTDAEFALGPLSANLDGWPSPNRWQRWQLHLLGDEVAEIRAGAAIQALTEFPSDPGEEAVEKWLQRRRAPLDRARSLVFRLDRGETSSGVVSSGPSGASVPDIALATIAVRALRAVLDSHRAA